MSNVVGALVLAVDCTPRYSCVTHSPILPLGYFLHVCIHMYNFTHNLHMCLCLSVCMYVCILVYLSVCIYVCMYVRMYVHTYVRMYTSESTTHLPFPSPPVCHSPPVSFSHCQQGSMKCSTYQQTRSCPH